VTGRPVADVDRFLAPYCPAVAGVHGRDLRLPRSGERFREPVDAVALAVARRRLTAAAARLPGTLLEDKGESVALHYRNASAEAGEAVRAEARAAAEASGGAIKLLPGKMVAELVQAGVDKGTAVERLMARPPFAGRTPVFVGDDVTDEAGFLVVGRLGGLGVRIGDGTDATAASCYLRDVQALHAWLRRAAAAGDEGGTAG
jgi:trehalose 6-phosphate phosphatase